MRDRLSKLRRPGSPRPSDGRGVRGEGKDRLSRERRSWNMSRIRGRDTTPEKRVRSLLHRMGHRFRLHVRIPVSLSASTAVSQPSTINSQLSQCRFITPDIVLVRQRVAIFVHGCFWHRHRGCKNCTTPTHNRAFWVKKLEGNAARDKVHQHALRKLGWCTIVVWECETEKPKQLERIARRFAKRFGPGCTTCPANAWPG